MKLGVLRLTWAFAGFVLSNRELLPGDMTSPAIQHMAFYNFINCNFYKFTKSRQYLSDFGSSDIARGSVYTPGCRNPNGELETLVE